MSAFSALRSDLFTEFSDLGDACLLAIEALADFFWALFLVRAIGARALYVWQERRRDRKSVV